MKKTFLFAALAALCLQAQAFEESFTTGDFASAGTYATITLSDSQLLELENTWTINIVATVNPSSPTTGYWVKDVLVTGAHNATDNYGAEDGGFRFFVATSNHSNITPGTLVYTCPDQVETSTGIIVADETPVSITLSHVLGEADTNVTIGYAGDTHTFTFTGLHGAFTQFSSNVPVSGGEISVGITSPEPATATLSLLALAGLAARRKRH